MEQTHAAQIDHIARLAARIDEIAADGLTEHLGDEDRGDTNTLNEAARILRAIAHGSVLTDRVSEMARVGTWAKARLVEVEEADRQANIAAAAHFTQAHIEHRTRADTLREAVAALIEV